MAYVPGYERDVFVSYAHVDNEPLVGVDQGWVSVLAQNIQKVLDRKLGRKGACALWMDHEITKYEPFSPQIIDAVCNAAALLVILSPGYLESPWCERELKAFRDIIERRGRSGIFVVELEPLGSDRPTEFNELLGYRFWVQAPDKRFPRILGFPRPDVSEHEYYSMLEELGHDLASLLKTLKCTPPEISDAPLSMPSSLAKTVFLAEATDDLWSDRKCLKDYLDQEGVRVVPSRLYPQDPEGYRSAVERDLANCDLFVQLLSEFPGAMSDDVRQGYPKLQHDLARAAGKPILQWRSPTLDIDNVEIAAARDLLRQPTVRAQPIADFKMTVWETLLKTEQAEGGVAGLDKFIFVNSGPEDKELAETVHQELCQLGLDVVWTPEIENVRERRKFLDETLSACDATILIYGNVPGSWVSSQLQQCHKALARRPNRDWKWLAICQFPPMPKGELDLPSPNLHVLNCGAGLPPHGLHAFLEDLP